MVELIRRTKSIPNTIFWSDFYLFLKEGNVDSDILRKLSTKLEENGNQRENATRIVYAINRVDDPQKAKYISWLTISLINNQIELNNYFRLVKTVENLIYEDLLYISDHVENVTINIDNIRIDEFLANGLIYSTDSGFAYTEKSYDLVEYGIRRGHSVRRPRSKPPRQILKELTDQEITSLLQS